MLPPIQFDYQFLFNTNKIYNIFTNRILTPKFPSSQFPVPKISPQPFFGIGLVSSKGASELFLLIF